MNYLDAILEVVLGLNPAECVEWVEAQLYARNKPFVGHILWQSLEKEIVNTSVSGCVHEQNQEEGGYIWHLWECGTSM